MTREHPLRIRARLLLVSMLALAAVAGCGAGKGSDNGGASPTAPSAPAPNQAVVYAAIGASDAAGVGSSAVCVPFTDCPNGMGYVQVIARRLAEGRQVRLTNLGIPGAVLSPEIQALASRYPPGVPANFITAEMPFVPRDSTLVTIFAGGNDTNVIGRAAAGGAGGSDPAGYIDQQVRAFGTGFDTLLQGIRQRASSARVVVGNLPNMAGIPYSARYTLAERQGLQRISVGLTTQVFNPLASQGVVVVDLMCDARSYDASNYSSDGFHPNDRGYQYIAEVYLSAILSNSAPSPRASCPQMALVPQ
jgi:lysophospholipase L1-like esterase